MEPEKEKLLPYVAESTPEEAPSIAKKVIASDEDVPPSLSLWKLLFSSSTSKELMFMGLGTCAAFLQGTAFPSLSVAFGNMADSVMDQSMNMTQSNVSLVHNMTVGDVLFRRITLEEYKASPDMQDVDVSTGYIETFLLPEIVTEEGQSELASSSIWFSIYSVFIGLLALLTSVIQKISFKMSSSGQHERREKGYYQNVLYQDQSWFDKNKKKDVVQEFSGHLDAVKKGTGNEISGIIQKITGFASGLAVAITKSWPLALVLIAIIPILAAKSAFNAKFTNERNRKNVQYRKAGLHALQVFSAIRTVAAFGGEPKEIENYKEHLKRDLQEALKRYYKLGLGFTMANFFNYAAYALSFYTAASILAAAMVSAGAIYTILLSLMLGASNLGSAIHNFVNLIKAQTSAGLIDKVVQAGKKTMTNLKEGIVLDSVEGRIVFTDVCFKYPTSKKKQTAFAMKNINIEIEPQTVTAFVGTKSSGKSSMIKLLQRFYEPSSGSITIDGHSIQELNISELRKHIGVVPQEPFLFNGTVKENIGCGKLGSSDEEIIDAARKAFADEFISELPQGYETILQDDENAVTLTREQKQLITVARIMLLNPDVVILDSPLLSEQIYPNSTQAMGAACEGRTTIIISDRITEIQFVNNIYVFNNGEIVESGTSDTLMEADGLYCSLLAEEMLMDNLEQMSSVADVDADQDEDEDQVNAKSRRAAKGKIEDSVKSEMEEEVEKFGLDVPTPLQILQLNMKEKYSVFIALTGAIVTGAVLPLYAVLYAEFFSTFALEGEELLRAANFNTLMFLALACGSALAKGAQVAFAAKAGETLVMRLKINAFSGIIRQPILWFEIPENAPEKLVKRLAIDAELIRTAGIDFFCNALTAFTTIVFSCGVILYSSWKVGILVILVAYPFLLLTSFKQSGGGGGEVHEIVKPKSGRVTSEKIMQDCVAHIQCVQELGLEDYFYEKYKKAKEKEEARDALIAKIFQLAKVAFSQVGIFFVYSGVFGAGGFVTSLGIIDAPGLFRIFFSTIFCANGIGSLMASLADHKRGQLAAALVLHLAEMQSDIDPFRTYGKTPRFSGELVSTDAHFSYPNASPIIDGLSFKADKRRILAIAGPASSGKSTVFALYERFYDVSGGRVLIDGYDVRDLKLQHLRHNIGLITKSPFFFDATIRDNIAYGISGSGEIIPEEKIVAAAKLALAHDFIMSLPQRYDTLIGPKGMPLSIREKQRLAFARALIRNPCILLIDEPKIYNEPEESRKLAEDVLDRACEGRTCIVLARSKYIMQHSDCVAFMGSGKILEMGSPENILAAKGIEYELKHRP